MQAIANTAPDLPPVAGQHASVARDHEYKRLGTCSVLAALDLHDGHVTVRVERRHRSREFIGLLKQAGQRLMNLLHLPPDTQEPLLWHPSLGKGVLTSETTFCRSR